MPWSIKKNFGRCGGAKPFAVVKDSDESVAGCHETMEKAKAQQAALYAAESGKSMDEPIYVTQGHLSGGYTEYVREGTKYISETTDES